MMLAQFITLPSSITNNINKFNASLSSTFYDGTNYITSLGDRVSSVIQPVDGSEEREVTRTPPNENLCENVITLNDERIELVNNLLNLYSGSPTKECFKYYDDNVTFEDPLLYTTGLSNLKAQFYGTSKIPVKSSIIEYKILENTLSVLRISLTQKFLLPFISRAFVLESEIILEFNENKKICKHRDLWYGNQPIVKGEILRNWAAKIVATFAKVPESE